MQILFETSLIRDFISDSNYDKIIAKAIGNHNKYEIEDGLTEKEILHSKIIRDADKIDNFRVKIDEEFEHIANITKESLENGTVSNDVFNDFMNCKQILISKRKTSLDFWVTIIAFIFDINFGCSLKYIKEKDYINILIDRIDYQNEETKNKMEQIRKCANNYIFKKINEK